MEVAMPDFIVNISKLLAGVTFTTIAAIGGASSNPWMAGLATLPAAGLAAYDPIATQLSKLKSPESKEELLKLSAPTWWTGNPQSWEGVCSEIVTHFPKLLQK